MNHDQLQSCLALLDSCSALLSTLGFSSGSVELSSGRCCACVHRPPADLRSRASVELGRSLGREAGRNAGQVAENESGMALKAIASFSPPSSLT